MIKSFGPFPFPLTEVCCSLQGGKVVIEINDDMPVDNDQQLIDAVRRAYSAAAERPKGNHPFPVGKGFAKSLGYPKKLLARLPSISVDGFAGVSNVATAAEIPAGSRVLDLGCGAGLDSLIAAEKTGPGGRVIGIDFSSAMLDRARRAAEEAGIRNAAFFQAEGRNLPIEDGSIDVALVNGLFNLNPNRDAIFSELARVVRQGGVVYAAELIVKEPNPPCDRITEADWLA